MLIVKGFKWRVDEFLSWRWDDYDNVRKMVGQFMNLNKSTIHKLTSGGEIPGLTTGQLQRFHMGESYTGSQEKHQKGGGDRANARKIGDRRQKTIQESGVIEECQR